MKRFSKGQGGFTLIELLVVIIIIGILAAIAVPLFFTQRQRARNTVVKSGIHSIQVGVQAAAADNNGKYPQPKEVAQSGAVSKFVQPWPKNPWLGRPMARYPNGDGGTGPTETPLPDAAKTHKGNYMYWLVGSPDLEDAYKLRGGGTVGYGSTVTWIITVP